MTGHRNPTNWSPPRLSAVGVLALAAIICSAWREGPVHAGPDAPSRGAASLQTPTPEIVVYASDLPKRALSEFEFWSDPASPEGRLVGTPNDGGELDPPPENDPHVTFKVSVQQGVPYRCWIHMKVGAAKGKSRANMLWVQFSDAVDASGKEMLKPGTRSYLTARGPARAGWTWAGCDALDPTATTPIYFRKSGEITVRIQAGMEGAGSIRSC